MSAFNHPARTLKATLGFALLLTFAPPVAHTADQKAAESHLKVATIRAKAEQTYNATRVYSGTVRASRASDLGFKFGGTLARLHIALGDSVGAGDLLATLDTASAEAMVAQAKADVSLAAANYDALQAQYELAQQTEQRFAQLHQNGHLSKQQYDEQHLSLRATKAQRAVAAAQLKRAEAGRQTAMVALDESQIHAPYPGRIQSRYLDEGSQVSPGQPVLRIVELGRLEAHVGLPEKVAASLTAGDTHQLRWADTLLSATLMTLLPEINAATRTLTAIYQVASNKVPVGAVVELQLDQAVTAPGYWVPLNALTESDRGLWGIYVVNGEQIVERRLVEILHSNANQAFVRGTIEPNDAIVSTGVHRIVPGHRVNLQRPASS